MSTRAPQNWLLDTIDQFRRAWQQVLYRHAAHRWFYWRYVEDRGNWVATLRIKGYGLRVGGKRANFSWFTPTPWN